MTIQNIIDKIDRIKEAGVGEFTLSLILVYGDEDLEFILEKLQQENHRLNLLFNEERLVLQGVIDRLEKHLHGK